MCGKDNSIISTPGSAEEPPCCSLPRSSPAAEPLELLPPIHANAYALLQLHGNVCLWSWAMGAWELDRQRPKSATTKGCHVIYVRVVRSRIEHA